MARVADALFLRECKSLESLELFKVHGLDICLAGAPDLPGLPLRSVSFANKPETDALIDDDLLHFGEARRILGQCTSLERLQTTDRWVDDDDEAHQAVLALRHLPRLKHLDLDKLLVLRNCGR